MMLIKTNVKQANFQMMWLSSSYNTCQISLIFCFFQKVLFFKLLLVFNIELVIPMGGKMNHHFNFLYIFFLIFMLIIVLKDKCDFDIHAYWFIFFLSHLKK